MKARFSKTRLRGVTTVVAPTIIDIDNEIDRIYKGDIKALNRIKKVIGLKTRHIAKPHITASDMALDAARLLLEATATSPATIDALIFVTQTPDYPLPPTACFVHGELGLPNTCFSFDVNQACAGFVYGLYLAHSLIDSGAAHKVILLCGDTLSRLVNPKDTNLAPMMGDGASATLLERSQSEQVAHFELLNDGSGFHELIVPKGGSRIPSKKILKDEKLWEVGESRGLEDMYMDGAAIFNFAVQREPKAFRSLLEYAGYSADKLDYFFFHQANKYIVDNIARNLSLPKEKVPNSTTTRYGNLSGCSVPATICDTIAPIWPLDKGLEVHMAGFGAGLSIGNAILSLDKDFFAAAVSTYNDEE